MFIDMHSHSASSDDSRANVDQYVQWVLVQRRRGLQVDGIVLTEHRKFDFEKDYTDLARENDVVILKGTEVDTRHGHFLVYGVTPELAHRIDLSDIHMDALELMSVAEEEGAVVAAAHPGRYGIGLYDHLTRGVEFNGLRIVEGLNGGNRRGEQHRADEVLHRGYLSIGGSDAHFVSAIGACLTRFEKRIANEQELVNELRAGRFQAVRLEQTSGISHQNS